MKYKIMKQAGVAARVKQAKRDPVFSWVPPKRVAVIEAESGEDALAEFEKTLGGHYTCREYRKGATLRACVPGRSLLERRTQPPRRHLRSLEGGQARTLALTSR